MKKNNRSRHIPERQKSRDMTQRNPLKGEAARAYMHEHFQKYGYYPVRYGMAQLFPFYRVHILPIEELLKVGLPTETTAHQFIAEAKRNEEMLNGIEMVELGEGMSMRFYEEHKDCKALVEQMREGGHPNAAVSAVGTINTGDLAEGSSATQFAANEKAVIAFLFDTAGGIDCFYRDEETATIRQGLYLGQQDFPADYFKGHPNDDGPEFDTGSGWIDS